MKATITIQQNENCKFSKDVLINGEIIGSVMANDKMTPFQCYQELKNKWEIDNLELQSDVIINQNLNY